MVDNAQGSDFSSGNPEGTPTPAPEGSGGDGGSDFLSVLSEGNRELATAKGWTGPESFDEVLTGYSALEKQQGNSVAMLGEEATPEERAAFFEKCQTVGRLKKRLAMNTKCLKTCRKILLTAKSL